MATVEMYGFVDQYGVTMPAPGFEHLIGEPPPHRWVIGSNGLPVYTELPEDTNE
jgi:hypothetical protein